jgi:hypothetical protein
MKDPRRLLEGDGNDIERNLLEAGQAELPNSFSKRRAAIAIGAIGAASVWPTAAGATAKISKAGLPVLVKLFAVGAVGVGTLGTAGYLATRPAAPPATETTVAAPATASPAPARPARATVEAPAAAAVPVESLEVERPAETARPAPVRAGATPRTAETASISEEMRVIDEARRALEAGDSAKAKRTLDAYQREHPRGTFEDEATLLKIEALSRSGKKEAAKSLARSYRASHPNSPHLRRIDSVLAEP